MILLLACGPERADFDGTLRDALDGQVLAAEGLIVRARATGPTSDACVDREAVVGSDGRFQLVDLCFGATGYALTLSDTAYWLPDDQAVTSPRDGDVRAWPWMPPGVWRRSGRAVERIPSTAEVREEHKKDGTAVSAPDAFPVDVVPLAATDFWVLTGDAADRLPEPLIPAGPQQFVAGTQDRPYGPWWYLSARFAPDGRMMPEIWTPPDGTVIDKAVGERRARYVPADAVAPGLWGVRDGAHLAIARRQ